MKEVVRAERESHVREVVRAERESHVREVVRAERESCEGGGQSRERVM